MKIHPTIWFLILSNLPVIAVLYWSSWNDVLWWVATSGLVWSALSLNTVMNLENNDNDNEHDQKIDEQVSRESEEWWKQLKKLEVEKEKLLKIETWEIGQIENWERYLIEQAENLRGLLDADYREAPMDYYLAHHLAEFAHLKNEHSTKETEWALKKVEVLGLMRQRQPSFKSIVYAEQELRGIQDDIAQIEQRQQSCKRQLFERSRRIEKEIGGG